MHPSCRRLLVLWPALLLLASCGAPFEPPLFNYLACRQAKTLALKKQGVAPVAANMQAMAYCKEQQAKALPESE